MGGSDATSAGGARWRRRSRTIPAVVAAALVLSALLLPLLSVLAVVDLVRGRPRLPLARLAAFAWCWAWLETLGVTAAGVLWLSGRSRDRSAHHRLQRWWADRLMAALRVTCGVSVRVEGVDAFGPGPAVLLVRHASLADSLLTAWVVLERVRREPRVVLKRELLSDPCLDVVGNRLPNCFLDRQAEDSAPGLAQLAELGATMEHSSVAVIFPEGTRANEAKRRRALDGIAGRDPERARRLSGLRHLLPPRPSGTRALLEGAAPLDPQVVVGWHVGFDGLDTFRGILAALARPATTVTVCFERVDRPDTSDAAQFERWLDRLWLRLDAAVDELAGPGSAQPPFDAGTNGRHGLPAEGHGSGSAG